ncbi:MAG: hypothetical protein WBQ94_14440 [Terracidiphilus sp.]
MADLRIADFENTFVLYFQTPEPRVNAYALASTLVALADSAKAAARALNSGVEIEIVVEALGAGSFRARITAIAREAGLFVKNQVATGVVIGVLATYIYDHTLAKKEPVEVIVQTDEVIVVKGEDRIIVPRNVYEAKQLVEKEPAFARSMDRMLSSTILDDRVTGFGLAPSLDSPPPAIILERELLDVRDPSKEEPRTRVIEEDADLYIVKAIMERNARKWEFKWHGINISAPIKDPNFYDDFARHNFTIAPGDEFQARIAVHQKRDDVSGVYSNTKYEVLHVYRHVSRPRPAKLSLEQ